MYEKLCPVCGELLTVCELYVYAVCRGCGSFIFISDRNGEEDNRSFYDQWSGQYKKLKYDFLKKKIFRYYNSRDRKNNLQMIEKFDRLQQRIQNLLCGEKGVCVMEIGFGQGKHLVKLLKRGCDAYGVDISEKVVEGFQERYPEYAERVKVDSKFDKKVDRIYCSALLEHLDNPREFIDNLSVCLKSGGHLIINALTVLNEESSMISENEDISFWKPCHRVIYSLRGFEEMLKDKKFTMTDWGAVDVYNNRLMSIHVREGYNEIINIRHSCLRNNKLPNLYNYLKMCREALTVKSKGILASFIFEKGH